VAGKITRVQLSEDPKLLGKTGQLKDGQKLYKLKGQCHEIFHLRFFRFVFLLVPIGLPGKKKLFRLFQMFAEIFNFSGASQVSTTLAKQRVILE
jgi:hypothetical protein